MNIKSGDWLVSGKGAELDALIARALAANTSIAQALARLTLWPEIGQEPAQRIERGRVCAGRRGGTGGGFGRHSPTDRRLASAKEGLRRALRADR